MVRNIVRGGGVMRPKILRDRVWSDWAVVGCEETVQRLFKSVKARKTGPSFNEIEVNEVGSDEINLVRAIVPDTSDQWVGLVRSP